MMTPQQLRSSILQFAIQGRLVEQRPEEGTGAELLREIFAAKGAKGNLTRSRGVRGGKNTSALSAPPREEIPDPPFEIPESWVWVRLGDISSLITKGTTPRGGNVSYSDKGVGFLRAENIAGLDVIDKSNLKYIDEKTHLGALRRSILEANDILITIAGTLGRTAIVRDIDLPLNANQAVSMIRLVDAKSVSLKYLVIALNSPVIQRRLTKQRKVTAIPNLTLEIIGDCLIPLPPLAEQKRIVAKIEELLPYEERYEKAWSRLEEFNKRFPEDMRKSVLQMAIQGKLVEQRPEEGTGAELLREILATKGGTRSRASALMTGGTGATSGTGARPSRPSRPARRAARHAGPASPASPTPVSPEDAPFEIPESWVWVRLGEVAAIERGSGIKRLETSPTGFPCIRYGEIYTTYGVSFTETKSFIPESLSHSCHKANYGDVLCTLTGEWKEEIAKATAYLGSKPIAIGGDLAKITTQAFEPTLLVFFFFSPFLIQQKALKANGDMIVHIGKEAVCNLPIPLPPLAEQKRIVAKLEEILPLCERLK